MAYWILNDKGEVVSRSTVQRVTNLELQTDEAKEEFKAFDAEIKRRFDEDDLPVEGSKPDPEHWAELIDHDEDFNQEFMNTVDDEHVAEEDDSFTPDTSWDEYLNMELAIPRDEEGPTYARVTKRLKDQQAILLGSLTRILC